MENLPNSPNFPAIQYVKALLEVLYIEYRRMRCMAEMLQVKPSTLICLQSLVVRMLTHSRGYC